MLRGVGAALVGGQTHADYANQLGIPYDRVFFGYDVIDNSHFREGVAKTRQMLQECRDRYMLPEKYFLASSRFVPKKNLPRLLEAFACYRSRVGQSAWDLVLLGDGPMAEEIYRAVSKLRLESAVHLPGFIQYEELPVYYGAASAFVHASTVEPWGLVINEAMAAGLPVIASKICGATSELLSEGVNGFAFDPYDVSQLTGLFQRVSAPGADLASMGKASQELIEDWGPERFSEGLTEAVRKARADNPQKSSFVDRLLLNLLVMR